MSLIVLAILYFVLMTTWSERVSLRRQARAQDRILLCALGGPTFVAVFIALTNSSILNRPAARAALAASIFAAILLPVAAVIWAYWGAPRGVAPSGFPVKLTSASSHRGQGTAP